MDAKVKTKEVDISNENKQKMVRIGECQRKEQEAKIVNLLKEFQDVFSQDYKYLKGLVQEMGEMKIDIKRNARPVRKIPYKLDKKYKEILKNFQRVYGEGRV